MTPISGKASHSQNSLLYVSRQSPSEVTAAGWLPGAGAGWRKVGWVSGHLNPGGQQFRDDDGAADPRVAPALAAYQAGPGSEQAALAALAAALPLAVAGAGLAALAAGQAVPPGEEGPDVRAEVEGAAGAAPVTAG